MRVIERFARYAECDVKGQLAKYDGNGNHLIAYGSGALTGNDADAVALAFYGGPQDRTESAFWYSGAKAAADAYELLGNSAKAAEMNGIAEDIKQSILTLLWDDKLEPDPGSSRGRQGPRPVRERGAARRRRPVRLAAQRHRRRPERLHDRRPG